MSNKKSVYVLAIQKNNEVSVLGCFFSLEVLVTHFIKFCKSKFNKIPDAMMCKKVVQMQASEEWHPLGHGYEEKMKIFYSVLYLSE